MDSVLDFVTRLPPIIFFMITLLVIVVSFKLYDHNRNRWRKPQSLKDYIGYILYFTAMFVSFIVLIA
jgi:hypothetical protein